MTKKEVFKAVTKLAISAGVGTIVCNAVVFTTPVAAMGIFKRTSIALGSFVMSAFASEKIADYADKKIDEVFSELEKMANEKVIKEEATA